jgi:hypothetical protein
LALPSQGTEASGFVPSGARSRILDRRSLQGWQQRLPSRLGTGALWLGGLGLIGPLKLAGLVVTGSLLAPCLLLLDRGRRQSEASAPVQPALLAAVDLGLPRALQAADLGLEESQLFRARHASVCTVHHDASGRILQLELPAPLAPLPVPSSDAHPVG